jgi:ubiquinone biosynthesis protein COQ9
MKKSSKLDEIDQKILDFCLEKAPQDGWTEQILTKAKDEIGIENVIKHCPNGLRDLARIFANWADHEMIEALNALDIENLKIRERIYEGVKARLTVLTPHKEAFKASMKFMLKPQNAFDLHKIGWQTADRLWWAAGDTSTDYNHYTKRILLSGVFASTTLFWLRDTSENNEKTWEFLQNRIDNVLKIGGALNKLKKTA